MSSPSEERLHNRVLDERDARIAALEAEVAYREEARVNQLLVTDLRVKELDRIRSLVAQQAEDTALWYTTPRTAPEAYIQQELRRLHALIEEVLGDV